MSKLSKLLSVDPSAPVELVIRIRPRYRGTMTTALVLLTTIEGGIQSEPTDSPPNAPYLARLLRGWTLEPRLAQQGQLLAGAGASTYGTFLVDDSLREFAGWADLDWSAAEIDVRVGARTDATGARFPLVDFEPLFAGVVDKFRRGSEDSSWEISVLGALRRADLPLVLETYGAFGGGLAFDDDDAYLTNADDTPLLTGGARTIEWVGVIPALPADEFLLWNQVGRLSISVDSTGAITAALAAGSVTSEAGVVTADLRPRYIALTLDDSDTQTPKIYLGTAPESLALVASSTLTGRVNETGSAEFRLGDGAAAGTAMWEVRLSSVAYSIEELQARIGAPVPDLADTSLVEVWQFDDAVGTTALGGKEALDLEFDGSLTWVSSLDGDDPVTFGGSLRGQTKPDGWGSVFGVPLVLVDTPHATYQAGLPGSTEDVLRLYVNGAPLVPDETLSTAIDDIEFANPASDKITLGARNSAHRLIPAQTLPARSGQMVTVTGSVSNDGDYEVLEVSPDGLVVTVDGSLHSESAGLGAEIRTAAGDRQYTYHLATSTVASPQPLEGQVTAWWRYRSGTSGLGLYSEALAYVLGATIDTSALLWDPPVGFLFEGRTGRDLAAQLALSAVAWLLERPDGTFATGTLRPALASEVVGRIGPDKAVSINKSESVDPFRRIQCAWGRTWQTIDRGSMAGSLTTGDRDRHADEWRFEPRTATKAVLDRYPLAEVRAEPFQTFLTRRVDAIRWLDYAAPLYLEERGWYTVESSGLGSLLQLPGQCYELEHPDHTLGLPAGTLGRIMSSSIDSGTDLVTLEVLV